MAEELLKRKISFQITGHSLEKLSPLASNWHVPFFSMNLEVASELKKIPSEIKYILNCAGPFNLFAVNLLEYISSKKIIYLDVSGEESFVYNSYQQNEKTQSTLIHACAFESFVADALALRLKKTNLSFLGLSSFYYFSNPRVSPGTRLSMQLVRHFQNHAYENSKWINCAPGEKNLEIRFEGLDSKYCKAIFAPYPEVVFFASAHKSQNAHSYILTKENDWTPFGNDPKEEKSIEQLLVKHRSLNRPGPDLEDRKDGRFMVGVHATYQDQSVGRAQVFGFDTYQITASIIVEMLEALRRLPELPSGVFAPSQLVDSFHILESLREEFSLSFNFQASSSG